MRLKRTQMSAAAYDREKICRVLDTDTDMIMLDLEDNVVPPLKAKARDTLAHVLSDYDFHGVIKCVKVNSWDSGFTLLDLEASIPYGVDEIKLSKCEGPEDIRRLDRAITELEKRYHLPWGSVEINVQIETPLGLRNAYEILSASPRVTCASFGYEDMASALGIYRDYTLGTQQATYMIGKLIIDANAAGVYQINGTAIVAKKGEFQGEADYVRRDTLRLKNMGFTSRGAIYPLHIDIINQIFTPSSDEVAVATQIVHQWEIGIQSGNPDCFVLDNGLPIDPGRVERAKRILMFHKAYQELIARKKRK